MRYFLIAIFATYQFLFSFSTNGLCATLENISVKDSDAKTQVDLKVSGTVRYTNHYLPPSDRHNARCYVDLYSTEKSSSLPSWQEVETPQINRIRIGTHASTLRVVFDLKNQYECTAESLADPFIVRINVVDNSLPQIKEHEKSESNTIATKEPKAFTKAEIAIDETPIINKPPTPISQSSTPAVLSASEDQSNNSGPSIWGWLQLYGTKDFHSEPAEDDYLFRSRARLGADWTGETASGLSLLLKGAIDIDRIFYDSTRAEEETDLTLHETYLQLNGSSWDISFGKQRVRWGKSDQLSPVDSINPQDYRQSIAVDLEDRVLPSWLLRSRWYAEMFTLEAVVQPWFQKSEIDYFDSDWALYRNLRQSILQNQAVPPFLQSYANSLYVDENKPSNSLENMSGGVRLTVQADQSDFGFSYHYGWETLPTIIGFPVSGINFNGDPDTDPATMLASISPMPPTSSRIDATYKRQQTTGFEWETTIFEPFGFRGEIAYIDKVAFLSSDLTSKRKAVVHLVTGIDYTSESEWYFNVQASWQYINDFEKNILYFEENTVALLGEVRKPVLHGNIEFAIKYNYITTDQSSIVQPSATLKYFRNVECEIGAMIYSGDGETLLGSYDQADQLYGIVKVSF